MSVAESLACSRLRDSRARWIEKIKREEAAPPTFRVPFTVASSPLSENLEQATESQTFLLAKRASEAMSEEERLFSQ